jgi:hypothetical protein
LSIVGNCLCITIPENWLSEATYPIIVDPTVGTTAIGSQTTWYDPDNEGYYQLFNEFMVAVNRFQLPENLSGSATAYVYAYETDYWGRCQPVLFADNNNVPQSRRSSSEGTFDIAVSGSKPASWRSTTFQINPSIASGTFIWFGIYCDWFAPRFDWGAKCYRDWWEENGLPNTYPLWNANYFYDFKLSMYFTYTSAQNYIRTLTQGVNLPDTRKLTADYKRNATEQVQPVVKINRIQAFFLKLNEAVKGFDNNFSSVFFIRTVQETATIKDFFLHTASFFRGLFEKVEAECYAKPGRVFFLTLTDTVQAAGIVFRGLILSICIVTQVFVRDYLLGRFLKARQEIILKSCVCCELKLESKIG